MFVLHFSLLHMYALVEVRRQLAGVGSPTGWVSGTKLKPLDLAADTFIHSTVSLVSL